jgi:hypothetical protein
MAEKVRKIPAAFEGTRAIPAQYTTDPDIATPEQIASIGTATDKARKLAKGQVIVTAQPKSKPLATSPVGTSATRRALRSARTLSNAGVQSGTERGIADPSLTVRNRAATKIKPNIERLTLGEKNSIKMLESSLTGRAENPGENEELLLLQEILGRKQMVEPEQNRLRSLFRRMDNLYHPETMTLGGADHWAEDPSARLAGRAHVSVNIHHAYVQIPAAIQAVRPVINYIATGPTPEERQTAQLRERLYFRWWDANDMDLTHEHAALLKELYGHTAAKVYWDPVADLPKVSIIERPENLYLGFGSSDYNRLDWAIYTYGMSPQSVQEDYGVEVIPVKQGEKWFPYTTRGTHADPIGNVWSNSFERNPLRRESAYEQMQIEVYDYWYKVPTKPGDAPLVYNAIFVGNTLVKNDPHPEYQGQIPYIHLPNGKIPGSPYGKPALYDAEQLLREKDERITAMAQMIQSVVGGQMWQLVGAEAPDEVPANALPKPGRVATPGPGNELRAIQPFIPNFQIEQYIGRIDRELAVATGLNDLLLGLAPSQVLGSSRAIAALIANYEARLAPKRKVFYSWMRQVWEMCARIWEVKDPAVKEIIDGEYRIEIVAPELTPRDTLELASTAINLVQNRIWSAERAMDRVGVEDPVGEKELIRDEQTDATLNPSAVATMAQVMNMMKQMQMQEQQMQAEMDAAGGQMAQAQNAARTQNPPVPGSQALNQPENQAQAPAESLPANAAAPGEQNLLPAPTGTNEVPA